MSSIKPKAHKSMADAMSALHAYYNRPDLAAPLGATPSNWSTTPANDNNPEDVKDTAVEVRRNIRPTLQYIEESMKRCADEGGPERNEAGQIIRIGKLHFSDGKQVEPAYKRTLDGDLKQYAARIPTGGLIGSSEKQERALGGDPNPQEDTLSNSFFAEAFGFKDNIPPFRHTSVRRERKCNPTSKETAAELAKAWANTDPDKVTYTLCPVGIARGTPRIGDNFIGMKVGRGGGSDGAQQWTDVFTAMVERKIWRDAIDELPPADMQTLDVAATARTLREVGGHGSVRAAERRGKKRLQAANDNLAAIMKKLSA